MELVLNLEWVVLATLMCSLWLHHPPHEGSGRRVQFIALALVLTTIFTVITMYDDMATAQNPAETRCFQREDDLGAHAHVMQHPVATFTHAISQIKPFYPAERIPRYTSVLRTIHAGSPARMLSANHEIRPRRVEFQAPKAEKR